MGCTARTAAALVSTRKNGVCKRCVTLVAVVRREPTVSHHTRVPLASSWHLHEMRLIESGRHRMVKGSVRRRTDS